MPFSYSLEDSRQFQFCFSITNRKKLQIMKAQKQSVAGLELQGGIVQVKNMGKSDR
jgi:hypothetical protein